MSGGGVFKNVANNSLGMQTTTYQITYTFEAGDIPASFNPMMFFQAMMGGQSGSNGATAIPCNPKQVTITRNGRTLNINQAQAITSFQIEVDSDLTARKD